MSSRASRSKSRERKQALAAGPTASDQDAESDTRGRSGTPRETSTPVAASDTSVHSDGYKDNCSPPHDIPEESELPAVPAFPETADPSDTAFHKRTEEFVNGVERTLPIPPEPVGARRFTSSCNMSRAMNEAQCAQLRGVKSLLKDDTKRVREGPLFGRFRPTTTPRRGRTTLSPALSPIKCGEQMA